MIVSGRSNLEQQQILFRQSGESAPVIMAREGAPVIMAHEVGCVKTLARTGDPTKRNDSWG